MNYNDHVLHATTTIMVGGDLSWSCRKKNGAENKSRAEKKQSCQKKSCAEEKFCWKKKFVPEPGVVKKKLDEKN